MKPSFRLSLLALGLACSAIGAHAQLKPRTEAAPRATPPAAQQPATQPGAVNDPEIEKAGELAAHAWLLLLDRKDWGSAWDASSGVFRQNVPLGTWMDNVPRLRDPFGNFQERKRAEVVYKKTLAGRPDGDYVTAVFFSRFEKKQDVVETVTTVREADGRWRVMGYTAR